MEMRVCDLDIPRSNISYVQKDVVGVFDRFGM